MNIQDITLPFPIPEGVDAEAFAQAMTQPPAVSLKLNRRKCADVEKLGYGRLEPVAWCTSGFYLDERPSFTLNPLLHAGLFYVQDASSMIYETIAGELLSRGLFPECPLVLDMCAAPGGKTTSLINALPDGAFVVANEIMPKRAAILRENIIKWGYPEVIVTNSSSEPFARLGELFDLIAVDAPCSGEGMMRKDEEARRQWSPALVRQCAAMQREILADAVRALKPGGCLIYSTCTFNRTENEEQVEWLVSEFDLEPVDMNFPAEYGIGTQLKSPWPAMRFMPHITRGEGLFAAVLRKKGQGIETGKDKLAEKIRKSARVIHPAVSGKAPKNWKDKEKEQRPDIALPLSADYDRQSYPETELSLDEALNYLRHEVLRLPEDVARGFVVVTYGGFPLGFVKNIGNRANNLYPSEWRIRNL